MKIILSLIFLVTPITAMDRDLTLASEIGASIAQGANVLSRVNNVSVFEIIQQNKEQYPLSFGVVDFERNRQDQVMAKNLARAILHVNILADKRAGFLIKKIEEEKKIMPLTYRVYQESKIKQKIDILLNLEFKKRFLEYGQFYDSTIAQYQKMIDEINQASSIILNNQFHTNIVINNMKDMEQLAQKVEEFNTFVVQRQEKCMMADLFLRITADDEDFPI